MVTRTLIFTLVVFWFVPSAAVELDAGGRFPVLEIVDGDTLVLGDHSQVRLVGIQAPKLPLGRPDFKTWPLAREAKQVLSEFALDKMVSLFHGGRRQDRHRRRLAHLYLDDGTWLQGEMILRRFARVYSFLDNRALVSELLEMEERSRKARRGIWGLPYYYVRPAEPDAVKLGRFELVEGKITVIRRGILTPLRG